MSMKKSRGGWRGFVVLARQDDGHASKYKQVSPNYETRAGAESFLRLYLSSYPKHDAHIVEDVKG